MSLGAAGMGEQGKRYEAWLMLEVALAFRNRGHQATWITCHVGGPPRKALFRGSPGSMKKCGVTVDAPGYIQLINNGRHYELHNSIQFRGVSGALHEVDLSIIPARVGNGLRAAGGGYPDGKPCVALELKRFKLTGSFSIGLMRAMLLAAVDLSLELYPSAPKTSFDIAHISPTGVFACGELRESAWIAVTTVANIGASQRLAARYGASVEATFQVDIRQVAGTNTRVGILVDQLLQYL
ncbi:hypothetical protein [Roseomonas haemaphysalidis]|uniref:Uncharacterized protein n=2 Tax=Roseomonas haemaphysalidis TaxID=2768162 RepID=A0ABS3KXS9_9PROT|nr:hypothetical protein [Roseomonas haemaphysalidis]MBO1081722.1 hypothetical protein [Roseomonas haemaphysalidis]